MRAQRAVIAAAALGLGLALSGSAPASAHHAFAAEFDATKPVNLRGTVTKVEWVNPHVWIHLSVDDDKGGKVEWAIEGRTPGQLLRSGWSRSSLKPGDVITIDFSPAKDGSRTGLLTRVRLADGSVLGQAPAAQ